MVIRKEEGGYFVSAGGWTLLTLLLLPALTAIFGFGAAYWQIHQHTVDLGKVWAEFSTIERDDIPDLSKRIYDNLNRVTKLEDTIINVATERARNIGRLDSLEHLVGTLQLQVAKVDTVNDKIDKQELERNTRWDQQNAAIGQLVSTLDNFRSEIGKISTNIAVLAKAQEAGNTRMEDVLSGRLIVPGSGIGVKQR